MLRLMIFDRTDRGWRGMPRLSAAWRAGASLYSRLGRLEGWHGATSWEEALDWLGSFEPDRLISEIQFWGHGKWGAAKIDGTHLDATSLEPGHRHHGRLCAIRERLADDALWWFRTCETFGAVRGIDFARRWTDFFASRAAGHTYVINHWQSGLHQLAPGDTPTWSESEGLERGTPEAPEKAKWSRRREPNTISFLGGVVPDGF